MNKKNLRIGNLVLRKFWNPNPANPDYEWDTAEVVALGINKVTLRLDKSTVIKVDYDGIKGIPLTEKLLRQSGFQQIYGSSDGKLHYRNGSTVIFTNGNVVFGTDCINWKIKISINIEEIECSYLHELQNFYKEFYKKELEFDESV